MLLNALFVGIGGFIGSALRYLISQIPIQTEGGYPTNTFVINILGAFLLGILTTVVAKNTSISPQISLMLRVGICGGFTTFSTFAVETVALFDNEKPGLALLYILLSTACGIGAAYLGMVVAD